MDAWDLAIVVGGAVLLVVLLVQRLRAYRREDELAIVRRRLQPREDSRTKAA